MIKLRAATDKFLRCKWDFSSLREELPQSGAEGDRHKLNSLPLFCSCTRSHLHEFPARRDLEL